MPEELTPEERIARQRARREAAQGEGVNKTRIGGGTGIFKRQYTKKQKILIGVGIFFFLGLIGNLLPDTRSPEEKEAGKRRLAEIYLKVSCESLIKKSLRDPDSYERTSWMVADGVAYVSYRAKNGFGGYAPGSNTCSIVGDSIVLK